MTSYRPDAGQILVPTPLEKIAREIHPRRVSQVPGAGLGDVGAGSCRRAGGSARVPWQHTILTDMPPSALGLRYDGSTITIGPRKSGSKVVNQAQTWTSYIWKVVHNRNHFCQKTIRKLGISPIYIYTLFRQPANIPRRHGVCHRVDLSEFPENLPRVRAQAGISLTPYSPFGSNK